MKIEGEMARSAKIANVFAAIGLLAKIVPIEDDRFIPTLRRLEKWAADPNFPPDLAGDGHSTALREQINEIVRLLK